MSAECLHLSKIKVSRFHNFICEQVIQLHVPFGFVMMTRINVHWELDVGMKGDSFVSQLVAGIIILQNY